MVVRMLERLGVKKENVVTASDGREAVDLEAAGDYDIVFLDIQMVRHTGSPSLTVTTCLSVRCPSRSTFSLVISR